MPTGHEDGTQDTPGQDGSRSSDEHTSTANTSESKPGHLQVVPSAAYLRVGDLIRSIRRRPHAGHPKGLALSEAARRTAICGDSPVSPRLWSRIEHGRTHPQAGVLLRMALAVDATPAQIRQVFHLAGYGHLYDTLAGSATNRPRPAEAGILADPRLPYQKRRLLLELVRDVIDALEVRARRHMDAGEQDPEHRPTG